MGSIDYTHAFYRDRHSATIYAANTVLSKVLDVLPQVHSAVDFGCGVGTWLSVLRDRGVTELRGMDGHWVEKDLLEIAVESFTSVNFEEKITIDRRYDLAISLEVAEHLRPESSEAFVELLVSASDFILFSAAIPFQGGKSHLNEQWPDYWAALFKAQNYVGLDFLRSELWNDSAIPPWYRQNILMFAKKVRVDDLVISTDNGDVGRYPPIALVHPDMYLLKLDSMFTVSGSLGSLRSALKRRLFTKR